MIKKFFEIVLKLKNTPRRGWIEKLEINNPESVADHSYSTSIMSMVLSDLEGINSEKIIRMALLHDLAESITGDITPNTISNNKKIMKENLAMEEILKNLPDKIAKQYFEIWDEYQKRKSDEAILLHEIDKLEMVLQAKFYQKSGITKDKLLTFFNTANTEIKNKNLRHILSNIIE